jgi:multicomponent Na+:H+ antiporter subunit G
VNVVADALVAVLAVVGGLFSLLGAVGILVMPDFYIRMHAASKAVTLGTACLLLAVGVGFGTADVLVRALLVTGFLIVTAPIAAHMIARAAYLADVPLEPGTIVNELRERYDRAAHTLRSGREEE